MEQFFNLAHALFYLLGGLGIFFVGVGAIAAGSAYREKLDKERSRSRE